MGICAIAFASSPVQLYMCFGAMGLGVGVFDAAINVQGILFEQRHKQQALNFSTLLCSGGGLALSIIAALAASTALKPEVFFPCLAALFVGIGVLSKPGLLADDKKRTRRSGLRSRAQNSAHCDRMRIADAVGGCFEGSIAEWGALYLVEEKDAPNALGALVYGVFSAMSFVGRLAADPIREKVGSFVPIGIGLLLGLFGMLTVLLRNQRIYVCLVME